MSTTSDFAEFADTLRRERETLSASAPAALRDPSTVWPDVADVAQLREASRLLERTIDGLRDAEEELRSQNEALFAAQTDTDARSAYYRTLFDTAPATFLVTTLRGKILEANAAGCRLLGGSINAVAGRRLACWVDAAERTVFHTALARSASSSRVEEWPIRIVPAHSATPVECRVRVRVVAAAAGRPPMLAWILTTSADVLDDF